MKEAMGMTTWCSSLGQRRRAAAEWTLAMEAENEFMMPGQFQRIPGPTPHRAPPTHPKAWRAIGFGVLTPKNVTLKVTAPIFNPNPHPHPHTHP